MARVVAVLQEMWDWRSMTSSFGYVEQAPEYFRINPDNVSGRRLYSWLGHSDLLVTNACPELVTSASGRGKPDQAWLHANLLSLEPYETLLVCGKVAQDTFYRREIHKDLACQPRILFVPHPAARSWTYEGLAFARRIIQEGRNNVHLFFKANRTICTRLEL